MATAVVGGLAAGGAFTGVMGTVGAITAMTVGAMALDYTLMSGAMEPLDMPKNKLAPIDKTALQREGELRLKLGEKDDKKKKRAKGKRLFKIDLDKEAASDVTADEATRPKAEQTGVQL